MVRIALDVCVKPGDMLPLNQQDWHYLTHVMRRRVGDDVEVLTPSGEVWLAVIVANERLQCQDLKTAISRPKREITLCQAILKGDHFSDVVERATEAGVRHFIPVISERTIVRDVSPKKLERWRHIAKEASEQSRQPFVPDVAEPQWLSALTLPSPSAVYALDPEAPEMQQWLAENAFSVFLVAGPEGGMTRSEYDRLYTMGAHAMSLGPRIYRAENAGAFATVLLLQ